MKKIPLISTLLLLAATTAFAQTYGGKGEGLDHLDEQLVMNQLASANLESLLDRDFANFNIPAEQRENEKTFIEIRELTGNLTTAGRRALAQKVAKGLDAQLSKIADPDTLLELANKLSLFGVNPQVTELEYFGENPVSQADLRPVAETAKRLYKQVVVLAGNKSDVLGKQIKSNQDYLRVKPQLQKMGDDKTFGEFSDNMSSYALCISLPSDDPQRKSLADAAIDYLKQFDNAQSGLQSAIRLQIGKLQLAEGDFAAAKDTFDAVVAGKDIAPPPTLIDQNNARYFGIVALISSRKLNDAEQAIPNLQKWELNTYLPTLPNPTDQAAVQAAMSMLKFRLLSAQSDLTNDIDEKKKKNDAAIDVLADLLKSQPELEDLVFDQLIARIRDDEPYASMNLLVLRALQEQGFAEVLKPPGAAVDEKALTRAIAAANELIKRNSGPDGNPAAAGLSAFFIAYAYDRMDKAKEAAAAFMDFAEKYSSDSVKANDAIEHARKWVGELRRQDASRQDGPDPETRQLYDRFLPLAINPPFNRKQFAFAYGALLLGESKFKDAAQYFEQVAPTDQEYAHSRYMELLSLYQELSDKSLVGDARQAAVTQILDLTRTIDSLLASAATPEDKAKYVEWVVTADGIAADLTLHELKQPEKSLEILNGFEDRIAGSKDPEKAHLYALQLRISDYMAASKVEDAVKALQALLEANPEEGQGLMFDVLNTVEHDEDTATDPQTKTDLAQAKAMLSGFVVDWAQKSKDPKAQAAVPIYQMYEADAKRQAAELNDDPTARKSSLQAALNSYQALNDKSKDDASLQGIGLTQYDLGNYQAAMQALGALVVGNKVGGPLMPLGHGDAQKMVENPQYWETNYKDLRSIVELYKQNPTAPDARSNLEAARQYIGVLYINNGKNTGGQTYHDDFEKLKAEIAALQAGGKPG